MANDSLPDVNLFDASMERFGWRWTDGLCGLIPSVSTLDDAIAKFGTITNTSELANGVTYDFLNGGLRVTVLTGATTIRTIVLQYRPETNEMLPPDMAAAMAKFGKLSATRLDRFEGVVFERPGMRIICDPALIPERVLRVEVFSPVTEENFCP